MPVETRTDNETDQETDNETGSEFSGKRTEAGGSSTAETLRTSYEKSTTWKKSDQFEATQDQAYIDMNTGHLFLLDLKTKIYVDQNEKFEQEKNSEKLSFIEKKVAELLKNKARDFSKDNVDKTTVEATRDYKADEKVYGGFEFISREEGNKAYIDYEVFEQVLIEEDNFNERAWLDLIDDDYDFPNPNDLKPQTLNLDSLFGNSQAIQNNNQEQKVSAWQNFWDNLLKPEAAEDGHQQGKTQDIFSLFTPFSEEALLPTLQIPVTEPPSAPVYLDSWFPSFPKTSPQEAQAKSLKFETFVPEITSSTKELPKTEKIVSLAEATEFNDLTDEDTNDEQTVMPVDHKVQRQFEPHAQAEPVGIRIDDKDDQETTATNVLPAKSEQPKVTPKQQEKFVYHFSSIISMVKAEKVESTVRQKPKKHEQPTQALKPLEKILQIPIAEKSPAQAPSIIKPVTDKPKAATPTVAPGTNEVFSLAIQEEATKISNTESQEQRKAPLKTTIKGKTDGNVNKETALKDENSGIKDQDDAEVLDVEPIEAITEIQNQFQEKPAPKVVVIRPAETVMTTVMVEQNAKTEKPEGLKDVPDLNKTSPVVAKETKAAGIKDKATAGIQALRALTRKQTEAKEADTKEATVQTQEVKSLHKEPASQNNNIQQKLESFTALEEAEQEQPEQQTQDLINQTDIKPREPAKQTQVKKQTDKETLKQITQVKTPEKTTADQNAIKLKEQVKILAKMIVKPVQKELKTQPLKDATPAIQVQAKTSERFSSFQKSETNTTIQTLQTVIARLSQVRGENTKPVTQQKFRVKNFDDKNKSADIPTKAKTSYKFAKSENMRQNNYSPVVAAQKVNDTQLADQQQAVINIATS